MNILKTKMSLKLYKILFSIRIFRKLFGFYGRWTYLKKYRERQNVKDNEDYWLSKDALWWHFKIYEGIELNKYVCANLLIRDKRFIINNKRIQDLREIDADIVLIANGVLMYLDEKTVDDLFKKIEKVKCIIVLNEGTIEYDTIREDATIILDLISKKKNKKTN